MNNETIKKLMLDTLKESKKGREYKIGVLAGMQKAFEAMGCENVRDITYEVLDTLDLI